MVFLGHWVVKDNSVHRVILDHRVLLANMVFQDYEVTRGNGDLQDHRERQDKTAPLVQWDRWDHKEK